MSDTQNFPLSIWKVKLKAEKLWDFLGLQDSIFCEDWYSGREECEGRIASV